MPKKETETCAHKNTEVRGRAEEGCEEEGYTGDTYCKDCGQRLSEGTVIPAKGHQWGEGVVTKEPTEEETGIKTYTCSGCGETKTEVLPKKGMEHCTHENIEVRGQAEAGCEEAGYTGDTYCQDCGLPLSEGTVIPAKGHSWDEGTVTKEPTAEETGIKTYICKICGNTRTEILPKKDVESCSHVNTEIRNQKEAGCEDTGFTGEKYCKDCGKKLANGFTIQPRGHQWDDGIVTKKPTEKETGMKTYTCSSCKKTRGEELSKLEPAASQTLKKGAVVQDSSSKAVYKVLSVKRVNGKVSGTVKYVKPANALQTTVKIPASIVVNGGVYTVTSVEAKAFMNHKKLTKAVIGNHVTAIGSNAFRGCAKLKTVTMGDKVTAIGSGAFSRCKKLKTVTMGKKLASIGTKAFYNCTSLTKLTIPSKVKKVGKQAFLGCKKLKNIAIKTTKLTKKSVGTKAFQGISGNAVFKVPKSKWKAYKSILKARGAGKKVKIKK